MPKKKRKKKGKKNKSKKEATNNSKKTENNNLKQTKKPTNEHTHTRTRARTRRRREKSCGSICSLGGVKLTKRSNSCSPTHTTRYDSYFPLPYALTHPQYEQII